MKAGLLEKFVKCRKNTLAENIFICLAAALAGTFYFYEYYYGARIHNILCVLITVVLAAVWLVCSALSGKEKKIGFIIFAFLYWSIPYVYTLWYSSRDNLHDYNKWLAMSNRIAKALLCNPFDTAAEKTGTTSVVYAAVLLVLVMAVYVAAFLIREKYDKTASLAETDRGGEDETGMNDDAR